MAVTVKKKATAAATVTESGKINMTLRKGCNQFIVLGGGTYKGGEIYPVNKTEAGKLMAHLDEQGVPYFQPATPQLIRQVKAAKAKAAEEAAIAAEEDEGHMGLAQEEVDTGSVALKDGEGGDVGVRV